jgi:two-component system nitrate/nitrite response regulator NarL
MLTVSIVNPNQISREGLRRILLDGGVTVVAACSGVHELRDLPAEDNHLVLIDVPALTDQLAALEALAELDSGARPVILAEAFDLELMLSCFESGARGYAVKDMECAALIALLQLAALGHKVMPSDVADALNGTEGMRKTPAPSIQLPASSAKLSQREHEVLCCLMAGYSNKRVARTLCVSEATVKVHVKAILRKLNVMNRTQAAMWATSQGLSGHVQELNTSVHVG